MVFKKWMLIPFILFPVILMAQTFSFDKQLVIDNFVLAAGIDTGLINNDSIPDIVGGAVNGGLYWFEKDLVNGGWIPHEVDGSATGIMSAYISDFNNDNKNDIVISSWVQSSIVVYYQNDTTPTGWTSQTIGTDFFNAHEVITADINNDGSVDIIGAAALSNEISVWYNLGGNPYVWQKQTITTTTGGARSVYPEDFFDDGSMEIVVAGLDENKVAIWYQIDTEPYWQEYVVDNNLVGSHRVRTVDIDNDGLKDIIAQSFSSAKVVWYKNNSNTAYNFTRYPIDNNCPSCLDVNFIDINKDGIQEIISSSKSTNTLSYYQRNNTFPYTWTKYPICTDIVDPWRIETGDLDFDGDEEIVASAYLGNAIWVFENEYIGCKFIADSTMGHLPLTVNFTNLSHDLIPLTNYAWDFDSDGTIDSNLENPQTVYSQPGIYSVTLTVSNNENTYSKCMTNYIHVFNGESALLFNQTNSKAVYDTGNNINLTQPFTIECWIKPSGWGVNDLNGYGYILDKTKLNLRIKKESSYLNDNCLVFSYMSSSGLINVCTPDNSLELNQWSHVALTFDENYQLAIYINGNLMSLNIDTFPQENIPDNGNFNLNIGSNNNGTLPFQGAIDEMRLWYGARSQNEIVSTMNSWIDPLNPYLFGYWRFNEAGGSVTQDLCGNYPLTLQNTDWVQGAVLNQTRSTDIVHIKDNLSLKAYPNPFNPNTTITFETKTTAQTRLQIYNIKGQLINTLHKGIISKGKHAFHWEGKDSQGNNLSSGIYFIQLTNDQQSVTKKVILIK